MDCQVQGILPSTVWKKMLRVPAEDSVLSNSSWLGDMPISLGLPFLETTQVAGCDIAIAQWNREWGWAGMLGQTVMEDV